MATRPALLAVCAALAASGCGESGPSEEERIRAALDGFARATAARDYAALCDRVFAPDLVGTLEQIGLPCEMALEKAFEDVRDPRISVGTVTVQDGRATAEVRSSARGQAPSDDTVDLVKVGEDWRIASLGEGQTP